MAGECRSYFFQKVSFDHQAVCYTGYNEYTEALHTVCFDLMRSVEREVNSSEIVSNIYGLKSHLIMLDNVTQQYLSVKIRENNNFNSSLQHFKTVYIPWGG